MPQHIRIPNDFTPKTYQLPLLKHFDAGGKRAFVVWPRRHGKDLTAGHHTAKAACQHRGQYWHFFPTLEHGRRSLWEMFTPDGRRIMDWIFPGFNAPGTGIVARKNDQQMMLQLKNGSIWRIMGADKIESVGAGTIGVVWSEFALCKPKAWNLVRPMLRQNGGWSLFITTPRGRNHAKALFDDGKASGWYTDHKTIYQTGETFFSEKRDGRIGPEEMMNEERASGMPEALIRQEYLCDWAAANVGSVWGDLVESLERGGSVGEFSHGPDGVFTSWDLGFTDATAIWFWRINSARSVDVIDHYEAHGKSAEHYIDVVESKPYRYVKHWLPHDARAKTWQTGVSAIERLVERWPDAVGIAPQLSIVDGIQAGRWLLQQPMRIHMRCGEGIEALRQYHYQYDEDKKSFGLKPEHDWSSHTADAFRYLACVVKHTELLTRKTRSEEAPMIRQATMDDQWEALDRERSRTDRRI